MKPSSIGCNYGVGQSGHFSAKEELNPNDLGTTSAIVVTRGVAVSIY